VALNALTIEMAEAMLEQLIAWREDQSIETVVVRGNGKAFCAGGDIRAIIEGSRQDAIRFFTAEYRLTHLIYHYPKPYTALLDGIVMGGGVGISIHGSARIATENTLWAMPETAIGFYPDIGATYFLSRLPVEIGTYLALTGARLKADDLLALGLATGFGTSAEVDDFLNVIPAKAGGREPGSKAPSTVPTALDPGSRSLLSLPGMTIEKCFAFDTVEEIFAALEQEQSPFAQETLTTLRRLSPTSLKIALRQLRRGKILPFDDALQSEFALTTAFLDAPDFREGVRALLIDKDKNPRWHPAALSDVSEEIVQAYFASCGEPLTFF
jgi:enoyl-CoA hydratase